MPLLSQTRHYIVPLPLPLADVADVQLPKLRQAPLDVLRGPAGIEWGKVASGVDRQVWVVCGRRWDYELYCGVRCRGCQGDWRDGRPDEVRRVESVHLVRTDERWAVGNGQLESFVGRSGWREIGCRGGRWECEDAVRCAGRARHASGRVGGEMARRRSVCFNWLMDSDSGCAPRSLLGPEAEAGMIEVPEAQGSSLERCEAG